MRRMRMSAESSASEIRASEGDQARAPNDFLDADVSVAPAPTPDLQHPDTKQGFVDLIRKGLIQRDKRPQKNRIAAIDSGVVGQALKQVGEER